MPTPASTEHSRASLRSPPPAGGRTRGVQRGTGLPDPAQEPFWHRLAGRSKRQHAHVGGRISGRRGRGTRITGHDLSRRLRGRHIYAYSVPLVPASDARGDQQMAGADRAGGERLKIAGLRSSALSARASDCAGGDTGRSTHTHPARVQAAGSGGAHRAATWHRPAAAQAHQGREGSPPENQNDPWRL